LKLNCKHQLLVYADGVNILGRSVYTIKKNAEASIMTSKEIGLEVNADQTEYMAMSREQNEERSHSIKINIGSFKLVEEFKYVGTTLTNQNSIQEEIKSRLNSGNACCHSVQNLLSSSLLSKNLKIKIH
jgi:flagellar basal body rod protein FlgG